MKRSKGVPPIVTERHPYFNIRKDQHRARIIARQIGPKRPKTDKAEGGQRWNEGNTAKTVFYCSNCKAPVVDSSTGRSGHAQRKPECKQAMYSYL